MDEVSEVWLFVPDTERRFAVSNYGHLMQVAKKVSRRGKVFAIPDGEIKRPCCSFKSGSVGWKVTFDKHNRFFARAELLALFKGIPLRVDTSLDDKLKAERETMIRGWLERKTLAGDGNLSEGTKPR